MSLAASVLPGLSVVVRGPGRRGWGAGKNWKHRERKRGKEASGPDHGRTKFANQWRIEIPQDLQASVHPVNGGGYDRFSEPLRRFWSRRRQSTSVNGVCQAQTTTSSILDESGGIKDHNSRKCLCRIPGSRINGGFERCRASRRAARDGSHWRDPESIQLPPDEATRWGWGVQGAEMVQLRCTGVGVVENGVAGGAKCIGNCASQSILAGSFRCREDLHRWGQFEGFALTFRD